MGAAKLWTPTSVGSTGATIYNPRPKLTFTDMHNHTEMSLKDGMIRIADYDDMEHVKGEVILNAERRGTGAVTATDHGNMYGQALMAFVAKTFGIKHIPGCEFYITPIEHPSRNDKSIPKGQPIYRHICAWAMNKQGYSNMCILQKISWEEGFYYQPRIDKEVVDKYGDGIMWSDACIGGTISPLILNGSLDLAYDEFMWYLDRFKDNFYIEYQNHHMQEEDMVNSVKVEWANKHGVPIIATTDAHFYAKDDADAHRALLCSQWGRWYDDPLFEGFSGNGYWLLDEDELLERYPVEYLNNTQLMVDKVEDGIITFGDITPPSFQVPEWFTKELNG